MVWLGQCLLAPILALFSKHKRSGTSYESSVPLLREPPWHDLAINMAGWFRVSSMPWGILESRLVDSFYSSIFRTSHPRSSETE
ncbi:hypothetical protein EDB81DRAFT_771866 [Dactylonectria macrodidyma]|uniref:Uncharacterized protein n=1 Tax=Dactylonectria macrodidyma TaxID=307937 RepID=A0A9P9FV48_9HYPO|nr:hypothetical protein EDB81DRAFT_771866 [Dactylonectria macrodidyma]